MAPSRSLKRNVAGVTGGAVFSVLALGSDCGDSVEPPVARTISGHVILEAALTDDLGATTKEFEVTHATGLPVHLVPVDSGAANVATTQTRSGRYTFTDVPDGRWRVRVAIDPGAPVESDVVVMNGGPVEVDSLLRIGSSSRLITYPNPFDNAVGVGLERPDGPGGTVEFEILTLDLFPVWKGSLDDNPPGYFHVHWGGIDLERHAPGPYWGHLRDADGDHYDLIFKSE